MGFCLPWKHSYIKNSVGNYYAWDFCLHHTTGSELIVFLMKSGQFKEAWL